MKNATIYLSANDLGRLLWRWIELSFYQFQPKITNLYEKIVVGRTFLAKAGSGKYPGIHAMNGVVSK